MTLDTRAELERRFKNQKRPSEQDFAALITSLLNKRDDQFLARWQPGIPYQTGDVVIHDRTFWELTKDSEDGTQEICSTDPPSESNEDWQVLLVPAADEDWVVVDQAAQSRDLTSKPATMYAHPRVTSVGIGTSEPSALLDLVAKDRARLRFVSAEHNDCALHLNDLNPDHGGNCLAIGVTADTAEFVTDAKGGFVFRAGRDAGIGDGEDGEDRGKILLGVAAEGDSKLGIGCRAEDYHLDVRGLSRLHGVFTDTDEHNLDQVTSVEEPVLDLIGDLRPVTFQWRDTELDADREQIGLVANEVFKVFPQAVKTTGPDDQKTKAISDHALIALLVKGLQEQQSLVQQLQERLDGLAQQLADIGG
jgi:hypothetical protein